MGAKIIKKNDAKSLIATKIFTFANIAYLYTYIHIKQSYTFATTHRKSGSIYTFPHHRKSTNNGKYIRNKYLYINILCQQQTK